MNKLDRAWEKASNNKWKYVDEYGNIFATVEANFYTNIDNTVKICMLCAEQALLAIHDSITQGVLAAGESE